MNKEITFPVTKLLVGKDSMRLIPQELQQREIRRPLIVLDKALYSLGMSEKLLEVLDGYKVEFFPEVEGDPSIEVVQRGSEEFKRFEGDCLIALGGGSSIDTAKAIAILATNPGMIREFEGIDKFSEEPIPIFAIPTTAGTGSEVSPAAVITDKDVNLKFTIRSWRIAPKVAFLDPCLLRSLPPGLAAATGMDALCHNVEYYLAKSASPLSEGINLQAVRMVGKNLPKFVRNRENEEAATQMLLASMMGEISFDLLRLSVNHAIAHPLGAHYNMHHGLACGIMLPYTLRFNFDYCKEKLPFIAQALNEDITGLSPEEASEKAIVAIERLKERIGIPKGLQQFGIDKNEIDIIIDDAMKSTQLVVNPRPVTREDIRAILLEALRY